MPRVITKSHQNVTSGFHKHAILFTPSKVWEFSDLGLGVTSAPMDITGNISGTILGGHVDSLGNVTVTTGIYIWLRIAGSTWSASISGGVLAQQSGVWTHAWFNEDGTGIHGLSWWGGRGCAGTDPPCDTPHSFDNNPLIHWGYNSAANQYLTLIGNNTVLSEDNGNVADSHDCSALHDGLWGAQVIEGIPQSFEAAETCAGATQPDVFDVPSHILSSLRIPTHYSPYGGETFNVFVDAFLGFFGPNTPYLNNVDVSSIFTAGTPTWVTDDTDAIWTWTADGEVMVGRPSGWFTVLSEATMETISGLSDIDIRLSGGVFAVNVCPASGTRYVIVYLRYFAFVAYIFKTTNNGASWALLPAPSQLENIFTVSGDPTHLYGVGSDSSVWLSQDDGTTWWESWAGDADHSLGLWVDALS